MSTRAVYTFVDQRDTFHVYKHCDGYPSGAAKFIGKALSMAWDLPRFEAAEFGAAFIAANKSRGGGVYLTHDWQDHGDLEYRYEITVRGTELHVTAYSVSRDKCHEIFTGTLAQFQAFANREACECEGMRPLCEKCSGTGYLLAEVAQP